MRGVVRESDDVYIVTVIKGVVSSNLSTELCVLGKCILAQYDGQTNNCIHKSIQLFYF
jgi:hypothetical protein